MGKGQVLNEREWKSREGEGLGSDDAVNCRIPPSYQTDHMPNFPGERREKIRAETDCLRLSVGVSVYIYVCVFACL